MAVPAGGCGAAGRGGGAGVEGANGVTVSLVKGDVLVEGTGGGVSGLAGGGGGVAVGLAIGVGTGGVEAVGFAGGAGGVEAVGFAGGAGGVEAVGFAGGGGAEVVGEVPLDVGVAGLADPGAVSETDESFGGGGRRGSDAMKSSVGARAS